MIEQKSKPAKYRNKKTEVDGHEFDSQAEANRYVELKILKRSGMVRGFTIQPSFLMAEGIRYRPDFLVCGADGTVWAEDVKGMETKEFIIKRKQWEEKFPWMELRIIR